MQSSKATGACNESNRTCIWMKDQIESKDHYTCTMQFGFMLGKGTTGAISTVRQMQEKCGSKGKKLYFACVDLEKAFDRSAHLVT